MKNAAIDFNMGAMIATIADSTTGLPKIEVIKNPISAKPAYWNVTDSYLGRGTIKKQYTGKEDERKVKILRNLQTVGQMERKTLTVEINGITSVYELGKKNEYFFNGIALTKTLESLAASMNNKIKIY